MKAQFEIIANRDFAPRTNGHNFPDHSDPSQCHCCACSRDLANGIYQQESIRARNLTDVKQLAERVARVEHSQATLEGLLGGLCAAITGRASRPAFLSRRFNICRTDHRA